MSRTLVTWGLLALVCSVTTTAAPPVKPPPHTNEPPRPMDRSPAGRPMAKGPDAPAETPKEPLPEGAAELGFDYPFEGARGGASRTVMNTTANVKDDTLTIGLDEADGYKAYSMNFKFAPVMDGTETYFKDSDSAQVVVVWMDKDGKVVGRSTNARAQKPLRDTKNPAADWKRLGAEPGRLGWDAKVPKGAVSMQVLTVYTDTLTDTPGQAPRTKNRGARSGDLPLITASFTGKLGEDGKWKMTANPKDVTDTGKFKFGTNPTVEQIEKTTIAVRDLIKERTGYKLVTRPASLDGVYFPDDDGIDGREIRKRIDKAIADGLIVNNHDTGFDIDPVVEEKK